MTTQPPANSEPITVKSQSTSSKSSSSKQSGSVQAAQTDPKAQERASIQAQIDQQKALAEQYRQQAGRSMSKGEANRIKAAENQAKYLTSKLDHLDDPVVAEPSIDEILSQRERTYGYSGSSHKLKDSELRKAESDFESAQKALSRAKYYHQSERLRERDPWEYEQRVQAAERELSIAKSWYNFVKETAMPKMSYSKAAMDNIKAAKAANLKPKYGEDSMFDAQTFEQVKAKEKAERAEERAEEREALFDAYRREDAAAGGKLSGASFTEGMMEAKSVERPSIKEKETQPFTGKETAAYFDDLTKDAMPAPKAGTVDYYKQQVKESKEAERQFTEGTTEFSIDGKTYELSPQALQTVRVEAISELSRSGKPITIDNQGIDRKTAELLETQYMEQGIPVEPDRRAKAEQTNTAYAAFKANTLVDSLNQGKQSAFGLSDYDVKLLDKYDENKASTGKSQAQEIRALQSAMVEEQKASARAGKVGFGMDTVPGPKPGQSEEAWLRDIAQQGWKPSGTVDAFGRPQFSNIKAEADALVQAYQDAGFTKTNIKVGKADGPFSDDIIQTEKVYQGRPYTSVQVNLPSGEQREYTFESKEVLRESARRAKALEGGFGAGFANVFLDLGSTVKFYAADVPAKFVMSGGNRKETVDMLVKGPKLNPSLLGDAIGAPIIAGIDSAQGKGDFGKLASENLERYSQDVTDPRYKEYYGGQAAGEIAFGIATLGIAPAIKAIQAGLKTTPALIKAGAEAARIVGIESKITSAKPIIVSSKVERVGEVSIRSPMEETLKQIKIGDRVGLTYGKQSFKIPVIGGRTVNIGTKQSSRSITIPEQISIKIPKTPNAFELVSESGKVKVGKGAGWFKDQYSSETMETVGTYLPKSDEFIPTPKVLSQEARALPPAERKAVREQIVKEMETALGKERIEVPSFTQGGEWAGMAGGYASLERQMGQTFAKTGTIISQQQEKLLPKIGTERSLLTVADVDELASKGFKPGGQITKGIIKETGDVLSEGKWFKAGEQDIGYYLTFSRKELQSGLKEQAKLAASNKAAREALSEISGTQAKAARSTKPSKEMRQQSTFPGTIGLQVEKYLKPAPERLMGVTAERLAAGKSPLGSLLAGMSMAEIAKSVGGYAPSGIKTLYAEKELLGFGGQTGFERVSRKKKSDSDYSYLRYPEGGPMDSGFQLTENVKDLNALASGLSGFKPLSGGSRNVVPSDFGTMERDLFGLDTGIGARMGLDLSTRIGVKPSQRMRVEQRAAQQEGFQFRYGLDVDLGHRHVTRQQTRGVTDPFTEITTTRTPPGIPRTPWDFGIPNIFASDGKKTRRKNRAYEVPDVLTLALGKSAQGVLGYGIDDYSQSLLEEYGGSLTRRASRRKRK